jgi:hypothetical protein
MGKGRIGVLGKPIKAINPPPLSFPVRGEGQSALAAGFFISQSMAVITNFERGSRRREVEKLEILAKLFVVFLPFGVIRIQ